ncbi:hypothetical protein Ahy_A10g048029 [Arachis hypogaea]|uniref:L-arabinokinase n=1 Tax=Arachis hypogaea TaxID=3818 RepID=A0A445B430_ARAHY|nr:hypothetical protein Ahy_A10g048029 [Arachis hypogaea]
MGMKQQEEYDGDGAAAVSSTQKMVFAYYVTGHGFGHATRVAEVVRHLILAGHDVHVVTAAPEFVFTNEVHSPRLFFRKVVLECGAVQSDALTVDPLATLERYTEETVKPRASILAKEAEWLKFINADLVVSDVVSTVCRVAADVGIPSVCVANFSWDIIYLDYVMAAGPDSRSIVLQIAEDYSNCNFLIRLPGYCPMPAFRNVIDVPLVVRRLYKSTEEVREELGIADNVKLVILNFGGQPSELKLKEEFLPSGWLCLVCGASDTQDLPANFKKLPKNVYTPDIIAASDCMIGYLIFIFIFQINILKIQVAAQILQEIALGKYHASVNHSEAKRLCDAAVPDDQRRRAIGQDDILIPEWYANAGKQLGC